jgi:hypothetical protein
MPTSYISEIFNHISRYTGLPPLVFICAVGLFIFLFAFGLLIIHKLRSINRKLIEVNRSLYIVGRRFENLCVEAQKLKATDKKVKLEQEAISENWKSNPDIRRKIFDHLKERGRPISYHDISRHLSLVYPDYDYDSALKELDQLEKEGEIEGHLGAGKLYFQINHEKNT